MKTLPKIKIDTCRFLRQAESCTDLITYDSEIYAAGYVTDRKEILIITSSRGYLRLKSEEAQILIRELQWITENNERFRK